MSEKCATQFQQELVTFNNTGRITAESKCTNNKKTVSDLQHRCHEDRAAHEGEDHEAGEALLSDAEELGLLPRS